MYTTPQLVTLALSLMNISASLTKSQHFLNPAILLFVHFVVSVLTSIKKQPVPSPHHFVHSKLEYCNSFYHNLPNSHLHRFQLIQNSLARTVFNTPKTCHITPLLASLHWLKIKQRIEYKLILTYKILTTAVRPHISTILYLSSPLAAPVRHLSPHCPDQNHEMHKIWSVDSQENY